MNFYKITAKIGHQGTGKHRDITFYFYANSISETLSLIRTMPMIKKGNAFPSTTIKTINEEEFVYGTIYNPFYKNVNSENITEVYPLENIVERFKKYLSSVKFTTLDGQILMKYCSKYSSANDEQKPEIEQDYIAWATKLINAHNNKDQILL